MSLLHRVLCTAPAILAVMGCANAQTGNDGGTPGDGGGSSVDASCGDSCDGDGDGVPDGSDECPGTPAGEEVNQVGCADSQVTPTLEPVFPPFGLTWTPTGDLGRAGGLTWTYTGIDRSDLFHIYWVLCDDPAAPCGLSLDGALDAPAEYWLFSAPDSDLPAGRLVLTGTTRILLADATTPTLNSRVTVTIVDESDVAIPFADLDTLGVTGRTGQHGAEIPGTGYEVVALAEVQDPSTLAWVPYLDYYDAAPTPDPGGTTAISFGASFYGE